MPGPQFTPNPATVPNLEDQDTVLVQRRTQSGETFSLSTIYAGTGNFELASGDEYYDSVGNVVKADGLLILDPVAGVLPAVHENDLVTCSSPAVAGEFVVVLVIPWNFPPAHLECLLKRGPLPYQGPRR